MSEQVPEPPLPAGSGQGGGDDGGGEESDSWSEGIEEEDDEATLNEEEADGGAGEEDELENLEREGDMPIEELMKIYGYGAPGGPEGAAGADDGQPAAKRPPHPDEAGPSSRPDVEETAEDQGDLPDSTEMAEVAGPSTAAEGGCHGVAEAEGQLGMFYAQGMGEGEGEESDEDYVPPEFYKKEIRVGSEYQAEIPDCLPESAMGQDEGQFESELTCDEGKDGLLWRPSLLDEEKVEEYLKSVFSLLIAKAKEKEEETGGPSSRSPALPERPGEALKDDDDALYLMLKAGLDSTLAIDRYREILEKAPGGMETRSAFGSSPDRRHAAFKERLEHQPGEQVLPLWSDADSTNFEEGLRVYGKHFHSIKYTYLPHKSVRELVRFYYSWKKTERHDMFVQKFRVEKKQYTLNPDTTDYMEHIIDQMDTRGAVGIDVDSPLQDLPPDVPSFAAHPEHQPQGGYSGQQQEDAQALGSPSSGLLIRSDPKHVTGTFHGTHFNEWGAVGGQGVADPLPLDPTAPSTSQQASSSGAGSSAGAAELPSPADVSASHVSSTSGEVDPSQALPQLGPDAVDELLDSS